MIRFNARRRGRRHPIFVAEVSPFNWWLIPSFEVSKLVYTKPWKGGSIWVGWFCVELGVYW